MPKNDLFFLLLFLWDLSRPVFGQFPVVIPQTTDSAVEPGGHRGGCGFPGANLNSRVSVQQPATGTGPTHFPIPVGSTALYTCEEPYITLGETRRVCQVDFTWSGIIPFCGLNVAMHKPIILPADRFAWLTNDGIISTRARDCYAHSSQAGSTFTWKMDLADSFQIHSVRILALADFSWSANVTIQTVSRTGGMVDVHCGRIDYTGSDQTAAVSLPCRKIAPVRWVRIDFFLGTASGRLRVCEVNVLAVDALASEFCPQEASAKAVIHNSCLSFHSHGRATWGGALQTCRKLGGTLMQDVHQDEQLQLQSKLQYIHRFQPTDAFYWIGLFRSVNFTTMEDHWIWTTGLPASQHFWAPHQPDKVSSKQFCTGLSGKSGWLWNDFNCDSGQGFWICRTNFTSCPVPDQPPNGLITMLDRRLGGLVHYRCEEGFQLTGVISRTCQSSGTWSGALPHCLTRSTSLSATAPRSTLAPPPVRVSTPSTAPKSAQNDAMTLNSTTTTIQWAVTAGTMTSTQITTSVASSGKTISLTALPTTITPAVVTTVNTTELMNFSSKSSSSQPSGTTEYFAPAVTVQLPGMVTRPPIPAVTVSATTRNSLPLAGAGTLRCKQVPMLFNGHYSVDMLGPVLVARYSCNAGFNLVGLPFLTCTPDGSWRGMMPLCVPGFGATFPPRTSRPAATWYFEKPTTKTPAGGVGQVNDTVLASTAAVRSVSGASTDFLPAKTTSMPISTTATRATSVVLTLSPYTVPAVATEISTSPWTVTPVTRAPIVAASVFPVFLSVESVTTPVTVASSQRTLPPVTDSARTWNTPHEANWTLPSLVLSSTGRSALNCPPLPLVDYAEAFFQGYPKVLFRCIPGYVMVGSNLTTCLPDGTWDSFPECLPVDCGQPEKFRHGAAVLVNGSSTFGSLAAYTCTGHLLTHGIYYRVCSEYGRWEGPAPDCSLGPAAPAESRQDVQQPVSSGLMTIIMGVVGTVGALTIVIAVTLSIRWLRKRESVPAPVSPTMYSLSDDHTPRALMSERAACGNTLARARYVPSTGSTISGYEFNDSVSDVSTTQAQSNKRTASM